MSGDVANLGDVIARLNNDYSSLSNLIKTLDHTNKCEKGDVEVRAHYLPFRNGQPMAQELLEAIRVYICNFALSRTEIQSVHDKVAELPPQKAMEEYVKLQNSAADLFIKAQKSTSRNGECGELLLYLLIEWLLEAPQILAKMPLKTNGQMPVHGSDGIHVKYNAQDDTLAFYWGEAKLHKTLDSGIGSALGSISDALSFDKMKQDISLVKRNFDASGFPAEVKSKVLDYLDPLHPAYHKKIDISVCLIGFDYNGFGKLAGKKAAEVEPAFRTMLEAEIAKASSSLAKEIEAKSLHHHRIEAFFIPFVSVDQLRKDFQNLIGWKQ